MAISKQEVSSSRDAGLHILLGMRFCASGGERPASNVLTTDCLLVSCLRNSMHFVAIKMGRRQGGPSRTSGGSGAYLNRYVTDEQRGRRPIFHRNPLGRGQLAVFLRCSLGPYGSDRGTSFAP